MSYSKRPFFLLGFAFSLLASGCGKREDSGDADVIRPVKFIEVAAELNYRKMELPAIIGATTTSDLSFKVPGQIIEFPISSSMKVKKGDLIGKLDQRNYRNEVSTAQTAYEAAKLDFDRAATLLAQDAISQKIHDERRAVLQTAVAQLDTAKKALEDTTLSAPFDGIISDKHVNDLDNVQALQKIATVQSLGDVEAKVQTPASIVANIKKINNLDSVIILDSAPDVEMPATFVSATTEADPRTQTFEVSYSVSPPDDLTILPGMTGTVHFKLTTKDAALATKIRIPVSAISSVGDEKSVWVIDKKTMAATKRPVTVGESLGETVIIDSGLEPGETIAGAGGQFLYEGMKVSEFTN